MSEDADLFITNLSGNESKWDNSNKLNKKYWTIIDSVNQRGETSRMRMFTLKTFTKQESDKIRDSIENDSNNVIFNEYGNFATKNVKWINPLNNNNTLDTDSISNTAEDANSHAKKLGGKRIVVINKDAVLSSNNNYILYYNTPNKQYSILYNPVHRKAFQDYYNKVVSNKDVSLHFGRTVAESTDSINMDSMFNRYCKGTTIKNEDGEEQYLDPSCNMFIDLPSCNYSAFFSTNLVDPPQIKNDSVINTMNSIGKKCVCTGSIANYLSINGLRGRGSTSFLNSFPQIVMEPGTCPDNFVIQNQVCQNFVESGGDVKTQDTEIKNVCSQSGVPTPAPSKPDDPSTKPDDPSSKPDDPSSKPDDPSTKPDDPSSKPDDPSSKTETQGFNLINEVNKLLSDKYIKYTSIGLLVFIFIIIVYLIF
jgi:hypothetical protein